MTQIKSQTQKLLKYFSIKNILILAIIIRVVLIPFVPVIFLYDGMERYIPDSYSILMLNFHFWTPPLYSIILLPSILFNNLDLINLWGQFLNTIFFILSIRKINQLLNFYQIKSKLQYFSILIFSFWSLVLSVSLMQDMLLMCLVISLFYELINKHNNFLKIFVLYLLILLLKPTGLIILPSILLVIIYIYKKDRGLIFKFVISIVSALILFCPWLIKNYNETGMFYSALGSTNSARLKIETFPSQLDKVLAYSWGYPTNEARESLKQHFSNGFIKLGIDMYYVLNIIIFSTFMLLLIVSGIYSLIKKKKIEIFLFSFILVGFSYVYWPFMGDFRYWDSGRYVFPIFPLLLIQVVLFFERSPRKNFIYLFSFIYCFLGIINSIFYIGVFYLKYTNLNEIITISDNNKLKIQLSENDSQASRYLKLINKTFNITTFPSSCTNITENFSYKICINDSNIYINLKFSSVR